MMFLPAKPQLGKIHRTTASSADSKDCEENREEEESLLIEDKQQQTPTTNWWMHLRLLTPAFYKGPKEVYQRERLTNQQIRLLLGLYAGYCSMMFSRASKSNVPISSCMQQQMKKWRT